MFGVTAVGLAVPDRPRHLDYGGLEAESHVALVFERALVVLFHSLRPILEEQHHLGRDGIGGTAQRSQAQGELEEVRRVVTREGGMAAGLLDGGVEATETAADLATFRKGVRTLFRWKVYDGIGTEVAVVRKPIRDRLRNAVSISRHASYAIESGTEGRIARFDKTRVSGGPKSWFLTEMEVDLSTGPSIPTEIPVALATTVTYAASSDDAGGDGAESAAHK